MLQSSSVLSLPLLRQPEEVSMRFVETLEPVLEAPSALGGQQASSRQEIVSSEVGHLLDEFFEFASALQQSLEASGGYFAIRNCTSKVHVP